MLYNACHLFLAGAETISTAMEWACYWFIVLPDLRKRMQEKIDANINPDKHPMAEVYVNINYLIYYSSQITN